MPNGEYSGFEKARLAAEAGDFRSIIGGLSCAARARPGVHLGAAEGGISPGGSIESDVDKVDQYCDDYCGVVGMEDCYNYAGWGRAYFDGRGGIALLLGLGVRNSSRFLV